MLRDAAQTHEPNPAVCIAACDLVCLYVVLCVCLSLCTPKDAPSPFAHPLWVPLPLRAGVALQLAPQALLHSMHGRGCDCRIRATPHTAHMSCNAPSVVDDATACVPPRMIVAQHILARGSPYKGGGWRVLSVVYTAQCPGGLQGEVW